MKESDNGHQLLSEAEEVIFANAELKQLLAKRDGQTKFLYFVLISFGILFSAIGFNKVWHPQRPLPISMDMNDAYFGAVPLKEISSVFNQNEVHLMFLYKEMTIKLRQAFWDAALIESNYVMHNYRFRWLAEFKPPEAGNIIGHVFKNTLYRAPFMGLLFETFNQGLRIIVDRTILNKVSDAMMEFSVFGGKDFSKRFVAHLLSLEAVKNRLDEKLKPHYTGDKGQMIKEKKSWVFWGSVKSTEDVTDSEEELNRLKGDLVALSEKWGSKFLKLVIRRKAIEIWKGTIAYYLGKGASNEEAQDAAIHLLSILTFCHPEIMNANFIMTGGSFAGPVKYLRKFKEITQKNKEFLKLFEKMIEAYKKKQEKYGVPDGVIEVMTNYMKERIREQEKVEEKQTELVEQRTSQMQQLRDVKSRINIFHK